MADLLDVGDWLESPVQGAQLAADTVPLLRRSDHPAIEWIFLRLTELQQACRLEEVDELLGTARFRFANLYLNEGNMIQANTLYTEVLADCDPAWPLYAGILNNRGITWDHLDRKDAAIVDYAAVIDSSTATDEARASALNNRADIRDRDGEDASSIEDRTAVLNLGETTYNRRYIAHSRRAVTFWRLGDRAAALQDIDAILSTADIAMEQKMEARLQRAGWFISASAPADAIPDLEAVVASVRNFDRVEERARKLLAAARATV